MENIYFFNSSNETKYIFYAVLVALLFVVVTHHALKATTFARDTSNRLIPRDMHTCCASLFGWLARWASLASV